MINCNSVIDLDSIDCDKTNLKFYVDTNIWYKITNINASAKDIDVHYVELISKLVNNPNAVLYRSKLSYSEIANSIDLNAFKDYEKHNKEEVKKIEHWSRKAFRHISSEREKVVGQIVSSIKQIESLTNDISNEYTEVLNYIKESSFESMIKTTLLDPTDMFMVDFMNQNGVLNVITDDGDYVTARDINVFTLNKKAISEAEKNGLLNKLA